MKNAQGMPFTVIIVAVLGLIMLIVLGGMFTGKISLFSDSLSDCVSNQGVCKTSCGPGESPIRHASCQSGGEVCCSRSLAGGDR